MWLSIPEYHKFKIMFNCAVGYTIYPTYSDKTGDYFIKYLTEEEITELIIKSVKDGVNYLFEKCKNDKDTEVRKSDCWYD